MTTTYTISYDRERLDQLIERFKASHGDFSSQFYLDDERNYKLECGDPRIQGARVQQVLHRVLSPADQAPEAGESGAQRRSQAVRQSRHRAVGAVRSRHQADEGRCRRASASRVGRGEGNRNLRGAR